MSDVFFYHSAMLNPPVTGAMNAAGKLITLLDAVLVNGFNAAVANSLTQTLGVATLITGTANNYSVGEKIQISGANESDYNGFFRVIAKPAADQVQFAVSVSAPASATGVILARHPPLGWTKPYSGTNTAVYRNSLVSGLGYYFQLDDAAVAQITVKLARNQTAFNQAETMTSAFAWEKFANANWFIIGDDRTFYFVNGAYCQWAGELFPYKTTDEFHFAASKIPSYSGSWSRCNPFGYQSQSYPTEWAPNLALRGINQFSISEPLIPALFCTYPILGIDGNNGNQFSASKSSIVGPNLADNKLHLFKIPAWELSGVGTRVIRGEFRGVHWMPEYFVSGYLTSGIQLLSQPVDGVNRLLLVGVVHGSTYAWDVTDIWD
jgi:hypothetical protein